MLRSDPRIGYGGMVQSHPTPGGMARGMVDVVFTTHNRDSLSRTMDLRNPTINKLVIINQRYEPWPEMQDLLDKMKNAEKRALLRAQSCNQP
ncbi:hypothetical protein evm_012022 [Chilo suppressalis]|nr:hypothetical protein evm_012022 [Chilo suppressalis]